MMSPLLRAVALIAALLPLAQSSIMQSPMTLPYTGTVTDAAGKPIEGVRVTSGPLLETRTDASGHYTLSKPRDLIRFSLPGYRPVTKLLSSLTAPVIMLLASEQPIALAECSEAVKKDKRQADMSLRLSLARDAKIKAGADTDAHILAVGYHVDWMLLGAGPHWSYGLPELKVWKQLVKVEERDITVDDPHVTIADYSGMLQDGSHYRFIGTPGQSISYADATVDSATFFDGLLETLCWNPR
jgi:hypothetical protein